MPRNLHHIAVIIPALNEELSIGKVLDAIPGWVDDVVVADNGSTDGTRQEAERHGARVVYEPRKGYGVACLAAMATLSQPEVVVFLDGDYSDYPGEMDRLVDPILEGRADMVLGSRVLGDAQVGALLPQQRFGNWLSCTLIRAMWKHRYTDLGPFRAIRRDSLDRLGMADQNFGWTVEMQIKALRHGLRVEEAPVSYRPRIGESKVTGTVSGVFNAGVKILYTIGAQAAEAALAEKMRG